MFRHLTAACFMTVLTAVHAQEPLAQAPGVPAVPLQATIAVDQGKTLGKVNRLLFGNNQLGYQMESWNESRLNWVNCGYGIWDPARACPEPAMLQLAKDVGMSVCRWPGGCGSHNFNWKKTVGPLPERANQKFGLPEFMAYCEALGAIPIITVAEYWGEAQDGADLVEYLNAPDDGKHPWAARREQDGHPKPYGAVWFEYGNESYHGNHGGTQFEGEIKIFTAEEYAGRYLDYRKAMRAVDTNIKLGAVFSPKGWNETVLKLTGKDLDFIIHHPYLPSYGRNDGVPDSATLFAIGLAGPNTFPAQFAEWKEQAKRLTGRDDIPLAFTEFNGAFVQEKPVPYRLCLGNALIVAEHLRQYLHEPAIALATYWQFSNEYWGMVKGDNAPYTLRPAYFVFQLYHKYFGDTLVDAKLDCPAYDNPGGYGVNPTCGKPTAFQLFPGNLLPEQKWLTAVVDGKASELKGVEHKEEDGVLLVDIPTDANFNYFHASKRMAAEPCTGYRLTAEIRTEGLEKSAGAAIQVGDGRGYVATRSCALTDELKSADWKEVSVDYITLADTKDIIIQTRRLSGGSKGKLYFRNPRVEKFIPDNPGAAPYLGVAASLDSSGKTCLMIVNKHMTSVFATSIAGVAAQHVEAFCLTGPGVDAVNESVPNNVCIRPLPATVESGKVVVNLPPFSLTAVVLAP